MVEFSHGDWHLLFSEPITNGRGAKMRRVTYFLAALLLVGVVSGVALAADYQAGAPVLSIVAPMNGATISGDDVTIVVSINSGGQYPVAKLRVFLDGQSITERRFDAPVAQGSQSFHWKTSRTANGSHQVDVQAYTANGDYLGMASCRVTVSNRPVDMTAPKASIMSPKEGEIVTGVKQIIINAYDDSGSDPLVAIFVDDALRSASNQKPYAYDWDTTKNENGPHIISVKASDEADNEGRAKPVRVIVRNPVKHAPVEAQATTETTVAQAVPVTTIPMAATTQSKSLESARSDSETTGKFEVDQTPVKARTPAPVAATVQVANPAHKPVVTITRDGAMPKPVSVAAPKPASVSLTRAAPAVPARVAPVAAAVVNHVAKPAPVAQAMPIAKPAIEVAAKPTPIAKAETDVEASFAPYSAEPSTDLSAPVAKPTSKLTVALAPATKPVTLARSVPVANPVEHAAKPASAHAAKPVTMAKAVPTTDVVPFAGAIPDVEFVPVVTKSAWKAKTVPVAKKTVRVASRPVLKAEALDEAYAEPKAATVASDDREYTIHHGDSLGLIAKAYGTDVHSLMSLNSIEDPANLQIGDKIEVPTTAKMIKFRSVVENAGGTVVWNGKAKTVRAFCRQADVKLKVGSSKAVVNAKKVKMDKPARVLAGRTVVPKSFVNGSLGISVD